MPDRFQSHDLAHTLEFNEGNHRYKLDGTYVPGVTTLIKATLPEGEGLIGWRVKQAIAYVHDRWNMLECAPEPGWREETDRNALVAHRQKLNEAGDIGSALHGYIEAREAGLQPPQAVLTREAMAAFDKAVGAYEEYLKQHGPVKLVSSEQAIASVKHQYAGKFDRISKRAKHLVLSDFKTSKAIYPSQLIQLGGYSLAIREWMGLKVQELEILRFGKDGEFEALTIDDRPAILELEAQFVRCRQTFDFLKRHDRR